MLYAAYWEEAVVAPAAGANIARDKKETNIDANANSLNARIITFHFSSNYNIGHQMHIRISRLSNQS